ncbi:MAG: LysE family translocator [Pseudomonadota bacterium]
MTFETWTIYVGTILLFMSTPGPSHLLMVSVSMSNGFNRSLATAVGDLSANALQILLAGFGLAAVLMSSQYGFAVVQWLGVTYLVWLGLKSIVSSFGHSDGVNKQSKASLGSLWMRGFITSAANPKAVVFFAALFPQFMDSQQQVFGQILILGITYLLIDAVFLACYGKGASWLAEKVGSSMNKSIERLSGAGLILTALLLGLRSNAQT